MNTLSQKSVKGILPNFGHRCIFDGGGDDINDDGEMSLIQVRGHVDPGLDDKIRVELPIGDDSSVTDVHKMCTTDNPSCTQPRDACTDVMLLQHGYYDDEPASKLLLVPHTGTVYCRNLRQGRRLCNCPCVIFC